VPSPPPTTSASISPLFACSSAEAAASRNSSQGTNFRTASIPLAENAESKAALRLSTPKRNTVPEVEFTIVSIFMAAFAERPRAEDKVGPGSFLRRTQLLAHMFRGLGLLNQISRLRFRN